MAKLEAIGSIFFTLSACWTSATRANEKLIGCAALHSLSAHVARPDERGYGLLPRVCDRDISQ